MKLFKKFISEFIGTFGLVVFGCGVAIYLAKYNSTATNQVTNNLLIAISFGLAAMCLTYAFGSASGAHLNPAVSFGVLLTNYLKPKDERNYSFGYFFVYIIAQILGAFLACYALYGLFGKCDFVANQTTDLLKELVGNDYYKISALIIETILSLFLILVVLFAINKKRNRGSASIVIGLTLTLVHIFGIPFTGTGVNPARSIATALSASYINKNDVPLQELWIFIAGPLIGAFIAFLLYGLLTHKKKEVDVVLTPKQTTIIKPQQTVKPQIKPSSQQSRPKPYQKPIIIVEHTKPYQYVPNNNDIVEVKPTVTATSVHTKKEEKPIIIVEHTKPRQYVPNNDTAEVKPTVTATPVRAKKEIEPTIIITPQVQNEKNKKIKIKRTSFLTKLRKSNKDLKDKYKIIKTELESYGVKSRISFEGDSYRLHRIKYAFITIRGKTIKLYLNLDFKDYIFSPIPLKDESDKKKYESTPAVLKVKSNLSTRRAVSLIDDIMKKANIEKKKEKNNKS